MRVKIFDSGAGNLHSLAKALAACGADVVIEPDPAEAVHETDALVLPGVGAFTTAADRIAPARDRVREALRAGLPTLGICLGMQLLFADSDEGPGAGLAVLPGRVTRLTAARVPHIGWNTIEDPCDPLFVEAPLPLAYFANGFACRAGRREDVIAWTEHDGDRFPAAVRRGRIVGVQFHPEKSSRAGVRFLAAWLDEVNTLTTGHVSRESTLTWKMETP